MTSNQHLQNQVSTGLSPIAPASAGLQMRPEFVKLPHRFTPHAMMSLQSHSSIRMIGFPSPIANAVHKVLETSWPLGVESVEGTRQVPVSKTGEIYEGMVWKVKLWGKPWKKTGKEELDSVRLLLSIFTTLATEGWTMSEKVTGDTHTMIFAQQEITARSPAFFAISFPLPNRISVIGPPSSATPAILSSIRTAVAKRPLPKAQPKSTDGASGINQEGFVFSDCYSFKISGVSRMTPAGFGRKRYEASHPQMLLSLLTDLDSNHFKLVTSLPLLPFTTARDLLIFASLPSSNITSHEASDSATQNLSSSQRMSRPEAREIPQGAVLSIVTNSRGKPESNLLRTSTDSAIQDMLGVPALNALAISDSVHDTSHWAGSRLSGAKASDDGQRMIVGNPAPNYGTLPTAATQGHCPPSPRDLVSALAPSESSLTTVYTDLPPEETLPAGHMPVKEVRTGQAELTVNPALKSMHGSFGFVDGDMSPPPLPELRHNYMAGPLDITKET